MRDLIYISLSAVAFMTCVCSAAPEPAAAPGPDIWTLNTVFTHPQQIVLPTGSRAKPRRFWYVILTLTNKTGLDVNFYPTCDLMTNTLQITPAGRGVPTVVFQQIKKRHQGHYPFLEPLDKTSYKILQGENNTKDIAVIWQDYDPKAKSIKIFISGLSNETAVIDHPVAKSKETGEPLKVYLRKTLELNYTLKSNAAFVSDTNIAYEDNRWIMR